MPDVSVDNTPVTVVLRDTERFTPANGRTIVANIQVPPDGSEKVKVGSKNAFSIADGGTSSAASEISVVLTGETTVRETTGSQVYISGFVV